MDHNLEEYDPIYYGLQDDTVDLSFSNSIDCFMTVINDAFSNMITMMLIINILTKILLQFKFLQKEAVTNGIFIFSGLLLVFHHFRSSEVVLPIYFIFFVMIGLVIASSAEGNQVLWIYSLVSISLNEMAIKFMNYEHMRLRIFFMYSTMKLLSLHGLVQNARKNRKLLNKNIPSMIAYMFHPAGLPFCGYSPPQLEKPSQDWAKLNSLRESIFSLFKSLIFLGLSDCILLAINDFLLDSIHSFFHQIFPV